MGYLLKQSSDVRPLLFLMVNSTDHISGKTGLAPTVTISKNGGAFAAPTGAISEIANGWYKVAGNAEDTNTVGPLVLHVEATGADPCDDRFEVVAFDPGSATNLGLSSIGALTADERIASADALFDRAAAIDGKTLRQAMAIVAAVIAGKVSGAGSGVENFVGLDSETPRVEVTTDAAGNRTSVEYLP